MTSAAERLKHGETIMSGGAESNAARYRRLSQPFASQEEAELAVRAFDREVEELREKHKIPDLIVIASASFLAAEDKESSLTLTRIWGDALRAEGRLGQAFAQLMLRAVLGEKVQD